MYHLLKSKLLEASGDREGALKLLEASMNLPGVKMASATNPVPVQERIALFMDLASIHARLGSIPEASKVMSDAKSEFENTSEAVRINLADADIATRRGDSQSALQILRGVPKESVYYTRAKIQMAELYLKHRKNKKLYVPLTPCIPVYSTVERRHSTTPHPTEP
jgi:tetratricopeptide repeat protein 21B